jgi:hypothetical protein
MGIPAYDESDELKEFKENIKRTYLYWRPNSERYYRFRKMIFDTTMSPEDIAVMEELQKPSIECNILESYISRPRGEFSKQEPSIEITAKPNKNPSPRLIKFIEGHIRYLIESSNAKYATAFNIFTDLLTGGFSVAKITTDYENPMSFDRVIEFKKAFDATMCGFDPLAMTPSKYDGRFCFELFPKSKKEAEEMGINTTNLAFSKEMGGFNWSYKSEQEKIVLIAEYYHKKVKRKKIVKVAPIPTLNIPEQEMLASQYKQLIERWNQEGIIEQPPVIIEERMTEIPEIWQYLIVENEILKETKTDLTYFPLVYFDGNSAIIRDDTNGSSYQYTRPLVYNALGVQKLMNFSIQSLANELENLVQHKFMASKESIPDQYVDAWMNVQKPNTLIYNEFYENNVDARLTPPREIARPPIPQEIMGTISLCGQLSQQVLGNYDAALAKLPSNQTSGVAIQETISLSNDNVMPCIVNYMQSLTHCGYIFADRIPKCHPTPSTLPVIDASGQKAFIKVNEEQNAMQGFGQQQQETINLYHSSTHLDICIKAGLNFKMQKSRTLQEITSLMQASPIFAEFMNAKALPQLVDNLEIRNQEELKELADQFMQEMQQRMQQAQQQQGQQGNPNQAREQLEMAKLQLAAQEMQQKDKQFDVSTHLKVAQMENERKTDDERLTNERIKLLSDIKLEHENSQVQMHKASTERYAKNVDLAIKHLDSERKHQQSSESLME